MGVRRMDVFGAEAEADDAGGDAAEDGEVFQKSEREGEALDWRFGGQGGADEAFVRENLQALGHARGKFATFLDFAEMGIDYGAAR